MSKEQPASVKAAFGPEFLRQDPDTGDIDFQMWDVKIGRFRVAGSDDVLEDYVRRHEPIEEACEFDIPRH